MVLLANTLGLNNWSGHPRVCDFEYGILDRKLFRGEKVKKGIIRREINNYILGRKE